MSWLVGGRDSKCAIAFMDDLRFRPTNRVQLTTDGHKAYLEAVEGAFCGDVDYAQLIKHDFMRIHGHVHFDISHVEALVGLKIYGIVVQWSLPDQNRGGDGAKAGSVSSTLGYGATQCEG